MCAEILGTIPDWISAAGNAALGIAAWIAVWSWKSQLTGTAEYRLARRVLVKLLRLRDELRRARSPGMQLPSPFAGDDAVAIDKKIRVAYAARFDRVDKAERALEGALVEAEVLWPGALTAPWSDLRRLTIKLGIKTGEFLEARLRGQSNLTQNEMAELRTVVFGSYDEKDQFDQALNELLERFRKHLEPHLRIQPLRRVQ